MNLFEAKQVLKNAGYLVESKTGLVVFNSDDKSVYERYAWIDEVIGDCSNNARKLQRNKEFEAEFDVFFDKLIAKVESFKNNIVDSNIGALVEINDYASIQFAVAYDLEEEKFLVWAMLVGEGEDGEPLEDSSPVVIGELSDINKIIDYLESTL